MENFFTNTPATSQQFNILSPQQQGVKSAVNNQALKMLQNLGGAQFDFSPIAQRARTQFQTQTIPGLAERFTSLGDGAQRSGAFQGALGQAGSDLEQGLASLQSQFGLQQQGQQNELLQRLLAFSLSPETETRINQPQPGLLQNFSGSALRLLPLLLAGYFGGPVGAAGAQGLTTLLGSLFGGGQQQSSNQSQGPIIPDFNALINSVIQGRS